MFLVAGLGNPGQRYEATRHNIGFEAAECLIKELEGGLPRFRFHAEITRCVLKDEVVLAVRPLTYMNESGVAIREIADFYKIEPSQIIVICDDINLPMGHLRIRGGGSAGGHNGLKSIIQHLGTEDFMRVRVGVGQKPADWDLADYVLSQMNEEECRIMAEAAVQAARAAKCMMTSGLERAMNRYNTPKPRKTKEPGEQKEQHSEGQRAHSIEKTIKGGTMMKKLGFGMMRLPVLNPEDPKSIDLEQVKQMVDEFLAAGFRYFDTAFPYHQQMSEIAARECLVKRYPRDAFLLTTKMPIVRITQESEYPMYFAQQLEKCGVEYFDYYLYHNIGVDRYANVMRTNGFEFAKKIKAEGKIRHFGISYHDSPELLERVLSEHPEIDFVQIQLNYLDWENPVIASRRNYEVCQKFGKPVVVMEPVKGGALAGNFPEEAAKVFDEMNPQASPASFAIRFAASLPNVMMVLSGMSNLAQMQDNISYMKDFRPLNDAEREGIQKVTDIINRAIKVPCTSCKYCMEQCPMDINIPAYFGLLNMYAVSGRKSGVYYGRSADGHGKAKDCLHCGLCEEICPQHIAIRDFLEEFAEVYQEEENR